MKGFWRTLRRPFLALAPMVDVTDVSLRRILAKHGKPDVTWTEFVAVEALLRESAVDERAKQKVKLALSYHPSERPIVAQLFGNDPHRMADACIMVKEMGFDGIDINMGCPDKNINKSGCGAELIQDPKFAQSIIVHAKRAVSSNDDDDFPISVKTRIGYNTPQVDEWVRHLLEVEPSALTLHLRTKKELSLVPARWTPDVVGRAVEVAKKEYKGKTLIIGNGDVASYEEAMEKAEFWGLDGVMIGRGVFGQPFLFSGKPSTLQDRLRVMLEHTRLYDELVLPYKPVALMRKFYKAYVSGFQDAKAWRMEMMNAASTAEVERLTNALIEKLDRGEIVFDAAAHGVK